MPDSVQPRSTEPGKLCLAKSLRANGRPLDALEALKEILLADPESRDAHDEAAACNEALGRVAEARAHLETLLRLQPNSVGALYRLANLVWQGGAPQQAADMFQQVLALDERHYGAMHNFARVLQDQGSFAEAMQLFIRAAALAPSEADPHNNLGVCLQSLERHIEAIDAFRNALRLNPVHQPAQNNLAASLFRLGRVEEAAQSYRELLRSGTADSRIFSNYLFLLSHIPGIEQAEVFREHRRYNAIYAAPLAREIKPHSNARDPFRRLRLGYVSADLRLHPIVNYLEPVLRHHDRGAFELYAYNVYWQDDAVTNRLRGLFDHWRSCAYAGDTDIAEMIRNDRIDVLVDLSGHTGHNRLLVFARKPAPVQVTWFGHGLSTGLDTIDYRFSDRFLDPENVPIYSSEEIYRLPVYRVFQPLADLPLPVASPAAANGFITFGSLNNMTKVNDFSISLWCDVLKCIPNSRFLLVVNEADERHSLAVRARFEGYGIDEARIMIRQRRPWSEYHMLFNEVDIILDTYPYGGATTTLDGLWMGVPVVTLTSAAPAARAGECILVTIGLDDWVARSRDEYISIARKAAGDLGRLASLRVGLRNRMASSPLADAAGHIKSVETAFRHMWKRWCAAFPAD